ncbi:MAG: hypothetical protein R2794_09690 [Chitinophagales bacterium]
MSSSITSIDAAYGGFTRLHIRVNKFSAETLLEFDDALQGLDQQGNEN